MSSDNSINAYLEILAGSVAGLDIPGTITAAEQALAAGVPARDAISDGLSEGMRRVGERYSCGEYFVPEVLVASRALYAGMKIVKPHLDYADSADKPTVVIGVVRGDVHDIGKNIVKLFWEAQGYNVIDLGKNVPEEKLLSEIENNESAAIGLSTLMTSTLGSMDSAVNSVHTRFDSAGVKVLVGGACVTENFANDIGADFYGADGSEAVKGLTKLLS